MRPAVASTGQLHGRIPSLDGLRAFSITFVLLSHTVTVFDPKDPRFNAFWAMAANGQIGVEIFFVISGFLITSLLLRELDKTGRISLRDFYMRRAFRILPPYYLFLGAILLAAGLGWVSVPFREWLSSALFYWNYMPSSQSWWLGHTWSLCVEEQFYLLWPVALVMLGRRHSRHLALAIVVAAPALRLATYYGLPAFREKLTFFLTTRADALMIGCLLALCASQPWYERMWRRLNRGAYVAGAILFILVVSPTLFARFHFAYQFTVGYTMESFCIGLIINWTVRNSSTGLSRVLNLPAVAYLGTLSYSLYLWQQPFIRPSEGSVVPFPLNIALIFALAIASYYLLEQPSLRARAWFRRRSTGPLEMQVVPAGRSAE